MVRPKNRTYRIDGHVYEEDGSYAKYYGNGGSLLQSKRWVNVDHYDQFLTELRALLAQFDYQASRNDYPKIERALRSHFEKPFACSVRFPIDQSFLLLGSEWDTAITKAALATAFKDKTDERQATIGTSSNNTGTRRLPDGTEEKDGKKDWNLDNSKSAFAAALHDLNSLRESDDHVYDRFIFEDHFNMNWVCVDECVEKVCLQTCEDSTSFPSRTCVGFVRFKDKPKEDDGNNNEPKKKGCWFASVPRVPRKIASSYPNYVNDSKPPARNRAKVTLWMLARWPVLPRFSRLPLNYSYTLNDVAPSLEDFKVATSFSKLIENHKAGYQMDFDTPLPFVNLYYTKVDGDDEYVSGYRLYFSDCNYEIEFEDEKFEDEVDEGDEEEEM